jgi:tRNA (guanine-N7-)-methyltransferase
MGESRPCRRFEAFGFLIEPESESKNGTQTPGGSTAGRRRALYGRAHGKALRSHQAALIKNVLPQLEIEAAPRLDCASLFTFRPQEIWLEIGFGGGEHLIAQAAARRDVGFLGAEPFVNGVAKALAAITREKLDNVRLRAGDAGALLEALPDGALSRLFILYPDPWPKRRHNKRRFISNARIEDFARVLHKGGQARFATDVDDYAGWTLRRFLDSAHFIWPARKADDWRKPWPDWRETRYEAKAKREGRKPVYLTFVRA